MDSSHLARLSICNRHCDGMINVWLHGHLNLQIRGRLTIYLMVPCRIELSVFDKNWCISHGWWRYRSLNDVFLGNTLGRVSLASQVWVQSQWPSAVWAFHLWPRVYSASLAGWLPPDAPTESNDNSVYFSHTMSPTLLLESDSSLLPEISRYQSSATNTETQNI